MMTYGAVRASAGYTQRPARRVAKLALSLSLALSLACTMPVDSRATQMHVADLTPKATTTATIRSDDSQILRVAPHGRSPLTLTLAQANAAAQPGTDAQQQQRKEEGGTTSTPSHESRGERIAYHLRAAGMPDGLIVMTVSALPVVELRAGVPVGFLLGLAPLQTLLLAVAGNLMPILPLLLLLRTRLVQRVARGPLARARALARSIGNESSRARALALFVGVPLPGTGAWTGAMLAFCLDMPTGTALAALAAGVFMAACVMTALCALGWVGAAIAGVVLGCTGVAAILKAMRGADGGEDMDKDAR